MLAKQTMNPNLICDEICNLNEIQEILTYFLQNQMHTDISFSVKHDEVWSDFSAHKLVLSMWSPVLADLCYNQAKGKNDAIRIEDVSPATFDAMLRFMYGTFSDSQLKDIPCLLKLYKAAVAYEIDALKDLCSERFFYWATPNIKNVFQLLDAGKLLNCEHLVQRCYGILQKKTAEVLSAQELCNITPAMLTTILDMPRVSFTSENQLISWVLYWVKEALVKNSYQKMFKEILLDFLPYLNFLHLTAGEFAKLYESHKGDLMSEQEGFSILMNISLPGSHPLPSWYSNSHKNREYLDINSTKRSARKEKSKKNRK